MSAVFAGCPPMAQGPCQSKKRSLQIQRICRQASCTSEAVFRVSALYCIHRLVCTTHCSFIVVQNPFLQIWENLLACLSYKILSPIPVLQRSVQCYTSGLHANTSWSEAHALPGGGSPPGLFSRWTDRFCGWLTRAVSNLDLVSYSAANGFPTDFNPESPTPEDAAKVCNLVYAMLMQRQRDIKYAQESEQMKARLTSSLSTSESARSRLENRLQAQERSIGALENRVSIFSSSPLSILLAPTGRKLKSFTGVSIQP